MLISIAPLSAKDQILSFEHHQKTKPQHENILQRHHRFDFFQFALWYNFPKYTWDSSIYGLKFGFPISAGVGKVKGLELAIFGSATEHINGVQMAFGYCYAKAVYGLQLSMVNVFSAGEDGWQIGMVNNADDAEVQLGIFNYAKAGSCQFGLINIIENGVIPFTILFNYADTAPKNPYQGRK
jgi:hypothetical protein